MAIPMQTSAVEVDTLPGDEVAFTIGNAAWVMKQLSKLYSNDVLATIREYSTNARDAHVEAGNVDEPIQVTLPTVYHPFFEVQDFGTGMSTDTLKEVYTKFGDSTKRESNDTNGMLGFGSKAALAYTDSFTVESVCDGFKTTALIARKADWSITLKIVSVVQTEDRNGTKISVPSRSHPAFAQIAQDFYRYWMPGTVLVDGKEPAWAVGEQLDDNLYYSKSPGTSYVVMGNVAYRIANPEALFQNRGMRTISFVAYVPNGSVEFTPSREDLEYTDETKKTLYSVIENFEKKMLAEAKKDIFSASDYFEAYTKYTYWTNKLGKGPFGDLEFKGEKFQDRLALNAMRYNTRETRYNTYRINEWYIHNMNETMIVTGLNNVSSHHKSRAKQYRDKVGISANYILFTMDAVKSVWIEPKRIVSWDEVREATKKPRQPGFSTPRPKRVKGTFDYFTKAGRVYESELPDTKQLFYITVSDSKNYNTIEALRLLDSDAIVAILAINRVDKFKRDNPQVKEFVAEFKKYVELDGIKFLDDETKQALAVGQDTRSWLKALPVDLIDDPEFERLRNLIDIDTNKRLKAYQAAYALASAMKMQYNFKGHNISMSDESLLLRYPLMKLLHPRYGLTTVNKAEYVLYINAKYAQESKKGNHGTVQKV